MSRYLLLLPAPEAEWALLPESEHETPTRSHAQFHEDLAAGGHGWSTGFGLLDPSARASAPRPDGTGAALVTEGPFSESAEQVVGWTSSRGTTRPTLRAACERFAARGEHIELRRLAE